MEKKRKDKQKINRKLKIEEHEFHQKQSWNQVLQNDKHVLLH